MLSVVYPGRSASRTSGKHNTPMNPGQSNACARGTRSSIFFHRTMNTTARISTTIQNGFQIGDPSFHRSGGGIHLSAAAAHTFGFYPNTNPTSATQPPIHPLILSGEVPRTNPDTTTGATNGRSFVRLSTARTATNPDNERSGDYNRPRFPWTGCTMPDHPDNPDKKRSAITNGHAFFVVPAVPRTKAGHE